MKKFFRNLFSGYFLILFMLLIELAIVIYVQFFLDDVVLKHVDSESKASLIIALSYIGFKLIAFIIEVIIFFKIINKFEAPDFKTPWIVGMLLLPVFFSVLFLIFANHGLRRRDKRIVKATHQAYRDFFKIKEEKKLDYDHKLGNAVGTFKYINKITELGFHEHNKVYYYKTGEEFFPDMMKYLREAQEFIFMEFFIISDGALWNEVTKILIEKAEAGLDVRLIYDDMGCGGTISAKTPKKLRKHGIKCYKFHPFRPILSGVYNNRDHRKIVIVDHKYGFTGGMNLADEYGNIITRFGYWKDTMVRIEGSAISNLISTFLQNYNLCAGYVSDYKKYLDYEYPIFDEEGFVMPFGDGPGGIDNALIGEQTFINMLHAAKNFAYISTPYLIPTYQLLDAMRNASLRGVEVHLILPGIPDKKMVYMVAESHFPCLLEAGVHIHIYNPGFNHMKTVLVDSELAFVGTINFDFRSLVHHFECGTILYKNPCLKIIEEDFKEMIDKSVLVPANFKLSKRKGRLCSIIKLIEPLL